VLGHFPTQLAFFDGGPVLLGSFFPSLSWTATRGVQVSTLTFDSPPLLPTGLSRPDPRFGSQHQQPSGTFRTTRASTDWKIRELASLPVDAWFCRVLILLDCALFEHCFFRFAHGPRWRAFEGEENLLFLPFPPFPPSNFRYLDAETRVATPLLPTDSPSLPVSS